MTNHRIAVSVGLAAATLVAAAGCGSGSKPAPGLNQTLPPSSASSAAPASTSATPSADPASAAVLSAYQAYAKVKTQMYDTAAFGTELQHVAYGKQVQTLQDAVAHLRTGNLHYTGAPASSPAVQSVSGQAAVVHDCFGSSTWIPVYTSGPNKDKSAVAAGSAVTAHPVTATLSLVDGKWLVVDETVGDDAC